MEYLYRYWGIHQPYVRGLHQHNVWPNYVREVWLDKPPGRRVANRAALGPRGVLGSILKVLE